MLQIRQTLRLPLTHILRARFSNEAPDPQKPGSDPSDKSQFESFAESFFNFLKQAQGQKDPSSSEVSYKYSSRVLYRNHIDPKIFNSNNRSRLVLGSLWTVIGYGSFTYIHPLITIIPAWFASGAFLGYFMGRNYAKKLVHQMDLSEDQKLVSIRCVKGKKDIKAKVQDMDLFDIVEVKDRNQRAKEPSKDEGNKVSANFIAVFDLKDENGKEVNALRLFIDQRMVKIENMDLFRHVLAGNQAEVDKFQYVEPGEKAKEQEKAQKEIDKQIEEEFERIKKETEEKDKKP